MEQDNLFQEVRVPLSHRTRPISFDDFVGQEHVLGRIREHPGSLVVWGPTGTGKTTLARLLAIHSGRNFYSYSPCLGTLTDLKGLMSQAREDAGSILFIDEIHRANRVQQDALLPHVEEGRFTLVGATTENPRGVLNRALLSRVKVFELEQLSEDQLLSILQKTVEKSTFQVEGKILRNIADRADGDARRALNMLEDWVEGKSPPEGNRRYDLKGDRHYDVISAFIKSLRGSDPDAALLWLAVMLDGGEEPIFIARRLVIFASEDVGNGDPAALTLAVSCLQAVEKIGMPEARINLAQATTYLASTVKSNASYVGINEALKYVRERTTLPVPQNLVREGRSSYLYPHAHPGHFVRQQYAPQSLPFFYRPTGMGVEKKLRERLKSLWDREYP